MAEVFEKLRGVGPKQAKELYKKYKTVNKAKPHLPDETRLALEFKVRDTIPRALITKFLSQLEKDSPKKFTVAGSYRREIPKSRDIDLLTKLNSDKVLTILSRVFGEKKVSRYQNGETKSAFYIIYGSGGGLKLDVYHANSKNWWTMLVYLTGSKEFNIRMRSWVKRKGWMLNQEALYDKTGKPMKIISEKDLFNKVGWSYVDPKNRN